MHYNALVNPRAVPELKVLNVAKQQDGSKSGAGAGAVAWTGAGADSEELVIGGAVTLGTLEHFLEEFGESEKKAEAGSAAATAGGSDSVPVRARGTFAMKSMLKWFASNQIRAGASLAGNLATASPISDMNPLLASLGTGIGTSY